MTWQDFPNNNNKTSGSKDTRRFVNRIDAGQRLGLVLKKKNFKNVLVLALPKGGIPVGVEVSKILNSDFDLLFVKKIGVPENPELAAGAISESGDTVWVDEVLEGVGYKKEMLADELKSARLQIAELSVAYRGEFPRKNLVGKTVIIIDDGLATGATVKVAIETVGKQNPEKIVVAVPVAAKSTAEEIEKIAELVTLKIPEPFFSVGEWYDDFTQVQDLR